MEEIDDALYSRQRPVFGDAAMQKLADSRIFMYGLGGVGIEIAKNLVLSGVKELILFDQERCSEADLGTQFFIRQSDVDDGVTRAEASLLRLSALNPYVRLSLAHCDLSFYDENPTNMDSAKISQAFHCALSRLHYKISDIQCFVVTRGSLQTCSTLNVFCRLHNIKFIYCNIYGVLGNLFCDFGRDFVVTNPNGESLKEFFIGNIIAHSSDQLLVKVFNNQRHHLDNGDWIHVAQVSGMNQVNNRTFRVTVRSPSELLLTVDFPIGECQAYGGGGIATQVVPPTICTFEPLVTQLRRPDIVTCDLSCPDEGPLLHLIFLTLKKFEREENRLPKPWCHDDWELCKRKLALLKSLMSDQRIILDEALAHRLISVAQGQLPPLCAFFGGVAAQEVIKAVTGVFMPYRQWLYLQYSAVVPRHFDLPVGASLDLINSRHGGLNVCVGLRSSFLLQHSSAFIVGCGAIGCELLKNLALMGFAAGDSTSSQVGMSTSMHTDQAKDRLENFREITEKEIAGQSTNGTQSPCLFITDNDHIEKSNLNRQFLFRAHHVGQSKSLVAAQMVREINPRMRIHAMQEKLWPANEKTIFTDSFLVRATSSHHGAAVPVLAALDCIPSRRYLDHRCVTLGLPLIESGTLGTKGHVQVIVPGRTESYNSQKDDVDAELDSIPYCTLKSFPTKSVHCIEWAREKFASQFALKPVNLSRIVSTLHVPTDSCDGDCSRNMISSISSLHPHLSECNQLTPSLARFLLSRPTSWKACIWLARDKFEHYFNHKARMLLHAFPPEAKLLDGTLFWQLPKRQPLALHFDVNKKLHRQFVLTFASLLADQVGISVPDISTEDCLQCEYINAYLNGYEAPVFIPSHKRIDIDDNLAAPLENRIGDTILDYRGEDAQNANSVKSSQISAALADPDKFRAISACHPISFEKDDDSLPHVDFITAAANLRAAMYGLSTTPRHEIRRIAGRIVPAIATTTAAIAGLVCLELVKYVVNPKLNFGDGLPFRNAFLNLALPLVLLSEPATSPIVPLPNGSTYTLWDRWVIRATSKDTINQYKLVDFIDEINKLYGLSAMVITQGNRMVYASYLPGHENRRLKPLVNLLEYMPDDEYVDLMVAFDGENNDLIQGPPVRFLLK